MKLRIIAIFVLIPHIFIPNISSTSKVIKSEITKVKTKIQINQNLISKNLEQTIRAHRIFETCA